MDHREKTEAPDRFAVEDLIGYKLNKDENKQVCECEYYVYPRIVE